MQSRKNAEAVNVKTEVHTVQYRICEPLRANLATPTVRNKDRYKIKNKNTN